MKKILILLMISLLIYGCSSTEYTSNPVSSNNTILNNEIFEMEPYASMNLPDQNVFYDLKHLTVNDMIILAMKDEMLAHQEYLSILEIYPGLNPFASIIQSEVKHMEALKPLFTQYGIEMIEDDSLEHVILPSNLKEAYFICVQAEVNNIAMYYVFLQDENLPQEVRDIFERLMSASYNHLKSFYRAYNNA
jgi:hypothetical protein